MKRQTLAALIAAAFALAACNPLSKPLPPLPKLRLNPPKPTCLWISCPLLMR